MRDWFESLQPREKALVATAAVMLALAVFWLGIWAPLERNRENVAADVEVWRNAIAELRSVKGTLRAQSSDRSRPAALNQSLVVIVDTTLRSRNLYSALQSSQPRQDNGIVVVFQNAAFDDLVLWLGDLAEQYSLRVQAAGLSPSGEAAGRVNGSITLER
ncbi:MAG TPA: type II secretion system protein M [Woeseiaceae bacterium]|nr:type II secretion system protein M [Woeseiaceae bacterium]